MQTLPIILDRRGVDTTWIGIDIGSTCTDLVLVDPTTGVYRYHKWPSTPDDQAWGFLDGLAAGCGQLS